jgi:hypothetical protein
MRILEQGERGRNRFGTSHRSALSVQL